MYLKRVKSNGLLYSCPNFGLSGAKKTGRANKKLHCRILNIAARGNSSSKLDFALFAVSFTGKPKFLSGKKCCSITASLSTSGKYWAWDS